MKRLSKLLVIVMLITCLPFASVFASDAPDSLELKIKYADGNVKSTSFDVAYFKDNLQKAKYCGATSFPEAFIQNAEGVYLSILLSEVGIKKEDVKTVGVYSADGRSKTFKDVFQPLYFYPNIENLDLWTTHNLHVVITDVAKFSQGRRTVEPMLALNDNRYSLATQTPKPLTDENRFRFCLGMEDLEGKEDGWYILRQASDFIKWVSKLEVEVSVNSPDGPSKAMPKDFNKVAAWAKTEVAGLVNKGAISGDNNGNFLPQKEMTRAEFASMYIKTLEAYDILDADSLDISNVKLKDVKAGHWGEKVLKKAVAAEIIKGDDKGNVNPNNKISRQEMSVMICRGLDIDGPQGDVSKFKDDGKVGSWAKNSVYALVEAKAISGYSDGTFKPKDNTTKEMAAKVLYNAI